MLPVALEQVYLGSRQSWMQIVNMLCNDCYLKGIHEKQLIIYIMLGENREWLLAIFYSLVPYRMSLEAKQLHCLRGNGAIPIFI